jgi:hypothetical protein
LRLTPLTCSESFQNHSIFSGQKGSDASCNSGGGGGGGTNSTHSTTSGGSSCSLQEDPCEDNTGDADKAGCCSSDDENSAQCDNISLCAGWLKCDKCESTAPCYDSTPNDFAEIFVSKKSPEIFLIYGMLHYLLILSRHSRDSHCVFIPNF